MILTAHGILAGAYKGNRSSLKATLVHLSADEGLTALCGKVKEGNLCDMEEPLDRVSCPHCKAKAAK